MDIENKKNSNNNIGSPQKLARLIKENICVVIKISASWCGPCKNKDFLNNYHKLKDNYSGVSGVKFVELDIDEHSNIIEDKNYFDIEVNSVPTFLISQKGSFTRKFEGTSHLQSINKYLYDCLEKN